ncbi:MAG: class II fumarate hydratase, partial [Thermoleophilia bacterium]|nr:class II fumarate hydratase [Thermoleophilia bacterium]
EVASGKLSDHFPLVVWQTGSGTQTNMNANEVIAARANELAGGERGGGGPVHPNDHVNRGQSSNDVFPTVMHLATVAELEDRLLPALSTLRDTFAAKAEEHGEVVMLGRTHLQDATPVRLGQVIGGWVAQLDQALATLAHAGEGLYDLALGGTAVGTGVNTHPRFAATAARRLAEETGRPFRPAPDFAAALAAHDAMLNVSAALRTLAAALIKIANDVRWYASGPRSGLGELHIPENEPGSSIMPGKVNPTQAEALTQVAVHVYGNDAAVAFADSQGNFQLNVYKPVILHEVLESIDLLADAMSAFDRFCAQGLEPNAPVIRRHLDESLMLVTALSPHIGYESAARVAQHAAREGLTLRAAALELGLVTGEQFDAWVRPEEMTHPGDAGD